MSFTPEKVIYPGSDEQNKFPNLNLTRKLFQLKKFGLAKYPEHLEYIRENAIKYNMTPFYKTYCSELHLDEDAELLRVMGENNQKILTKMEENIEYARTKEGDLELRDSIIEKAEYMSVIGVGLDTVLSVLDEAFENKTCSLGIKFKVLFLMMRSCIFHLSRSEMGRVVRIAKRYGDDQIDWETRNKFKLYCGLYSVWNRDFDTAATLFHQIFTTFSLTEVVSFHDLGIYTILVSTICLSRNNLEKDVINAPEIQEATYKDLHIRKIPQLIYQCLYQPYFTELEHVDEFVSKDIFLTDHVAYVVDKLRITAYKQLLCSFKSLKVDFLANAIGQSVEDVDHELARYISNGQLACKIDKVNGLVYNSVVEKKDIQFQQLITEGDVIMSRINNIIKHVP